MVAPDDVRPPDDNVAVFLHGLSSGPHEWMHQLADLPPGFVGMTPSLLGVSDSGTPFALDDAVAAVAAELDRSGVPRAHLCGLALGALVVTRFAAVHPDRVASLVLVAGQVRTDAQTSRLRSLLLRVLPAQVVAPRRPDRETLSRVNDGLTGIDLTGDLPQITAPTLVVCGADDRLRKAAARELAAGIRGARLVWIPLAGRHPHREQPARFDRELAAFWTQG